MELTKEVAERLDLAYVEGTARAIRDALVDGVPIEVNYQPGDGTSYRLIFIPAQDLRVAPARVAPIGGGEPIEWDARFSLGAPRKVGSAVVVWMDHNAVGLDLANGGFVGSYIASVFDTTAWSGEALALLLAKIDVG